MRSISSAIQEWYQQPPGSWLLTSECEEAARILGNIKGRYLVQIGGTSDLSHSAASSIPYQIRLMSDPNVDLSLTVQTDYQDLPLLPNSVDVVVLIHLLEFIDCPVKLLQEIFQALNPGGQLLIFGFNPWSFWGISKCLYCKKNIPWNGKFWSRAQVRRWLVDHNYFILLSKTFCYRFPRKKKPGRRIQLFSEVAGQLTFPAAGGVYLLMAKKSVYSPVLSEIIWKNKEIMMCNLVKLTSLSYYC